MRPLITPDLVIFDCDGVLIDSETIACRVLSDALAGEGILISAEEIAERYVGLTGNAVFADLQARTGRSVREGFRERTHPRLAAAFEAELQPMRGVAALLASLPVRACVASGSSPDRLRHSLTLTGLIDCFGTDIFSAEQVARGKPAPDLFLLAAATMAVRPDACWVIEDSRAGIEAAGAAGMTAIGFTGGSHCRADHGDRLRQAGATRILATMDELTSLLATVSR